MGRLDVSADGVWGFTFPFFYPLVAVAVTVPMMGAPGFP
jgi:hypothetical protein